MAPTRTKKLRKSTESTTSSVDMSNFPAPPQMIPTKSRSAVRTPTNTRSPIKKAGKGITFAQKQALIDNLQLEITERARKLRAQYVLQAQTMRSRLEIRVNRIPVALRRANMGDLVAKYSEAATKTTRKSPHKIEKANSPSKNRVDDIREQSRASPSPRPKKRMSDEITIDKENEDIDYPKKRLRGGPAPPARTTSREKIPPSQVLSPRSANSRTLPRSPIRSQLPAKSLLGRPISPLKPVAPTPAGGAAGILTNMVEKAKATRGGATRKATETKKAAEVKPAANTGVGRGRRAPPPPAPTTRTGRGRASTISDSSDSSNATVVRKPVPQKKEPAKRTVMGTLRGMGGGASKKAPVPKAAAPAASTASTGTRVLRKRN